MTGHADLERRRCWYCGAPITGKRACAAHADLEREDPAAIAERPPVSEAELGLGSQWKLPKHGGRGELY